MRLQFSTNLFPRRYMYTDDLLPYKLALRPPPAPSTVAILGAEGNQKPFVKLVRSHQTLLKSITLLCRLSIVAKQCTNRKTTKKNAVKRYQADHAR